MRFRRIIIPVGAWLALSALVTGCSPARSADAPASEAPAQTCAIAYPDAEPSASELAGADSLLQREGQEAAGNSVARPVVPPIDAGAPPKTETATFALG